MKANSILARIGGFFFIASIISAWIVFNARSASAATNPCAAIGEFSGCTGGDDYDTPQQPCTSGDCTNCSGMPVWWVSEPLLNLRLEDEPLGYQPAIGPRISFHLSYRQRGSVDGMPTVFGVGSNWTCSFQAVFPGGQGYYLHRGGAGWIPYYPYYAQQWDGSIVSPLSPQGWQIDYANGAVDTFGAVFTDTNGVQSFFISSQTDPLGNSTTYSYATNDAGIFVLNSLTDAVGNVTHVYYDSSAFPNQITRVVDPFSRTCYLSYDSDGFLTNIVDVAGMSSSFTYGSATERTYVTNLTTPYGNTGFAFGGSDVTNATLDSDGVNRYALVTLPTGGHHLYLYQKNCIGLLGSYSPAVPDTSPIANTFYTTLTNYNSFHWGPLQYDSLSTTNPMAMSGIDYVLGRMKNWLIEDDQVAEFPASAVNLERAASPDGSTPGQATWYDYEGKQTGYFNYEGNSDLVSFTAQVLPDSTTHYDYKMRSSDLLVTNEVETYTAEDDLVATRTNSFIYADNNIDLQQWIGPNREQVVSNYFASGNAFHEPDASYDALNQATLYTYNSVGQWTSRQTPAGLVTTNIYYTSGTSVDRLASNIDLQIGRINTYTYYPNGLVQTHTDERGLTTTSYWDNLQRLTQMSYPDGTTTSNLYTYLDVTGRKDRLNNWTLYQYNGIRQRIAETNANGVVTGYDYCQCGLLYAVTNAVGDPAQMVTSYVYDNQGHRTWIYYPDATVENIYDPLGRLVWTCDGWGCREFEYNNQSLLTQVLNFTGVEKFTVYNNEDRPVSVTDANQVTVANTYDVLGRRTTRTYPDGGVEAFGYSAFGLIAYTNQIGASNFYVYDPALRKTFETNANGEVIRYTNNAAGDLLTLTDGKGQTTTWNYDAYGRVTNKLDQSNAMVFAYQYDANNRLTVRSNNLAVRTFYSYDNVGNLTNLEYYPASTASVAYQYDALNRLTNMLDGVGTTAYTYTSGGFLATEAGPFANDTVTNFYTNRMRIGLTLAQPVGYWSNDFTYDGIKRLTSVTSEAGSLVYNYDVLRQREVTNLTLPNASYVSNVFDPVARLLGTYLTTSSGTVLDAAGYGYNLAGQRTNFTNTAGTIASYAYDPAGQLKVAASTTSSESRGYAYDAAWNLTWRTNNLTPTGYTNNGVNELTSEGSVKCYYDAAGNLTNKVSGTHATNYLYDGENRLQAVVYGVGVGISQTTKETTFVYDGLGRLREQLQWQTNSGGGNQQVVHTDTGGGGSSGWTLESGIYYLYDGKRVIQERDTNNTPTVSYTRGNDLSGSLEGAGGIGGLLERADGYNPTNGSWANHNYYHVDGNGNITYLESDSQTLAASYRYDAYGNTLASSGTLAASNTYRFSSKEFIPTAGLYYYLYRFYDPALQRWVSRDVLGEIGFQVLHLVNEPLDIKKLGIDINQLETRFLIAVALQNQNIKAGKYNQKLINLSPEDRTYIMTFADVFQLVKRNSAGFWPAELIENSPNLLDFCYNNSISYIDPHGDQIFITIVAITVITAIVVDPIIQILTGNSPTGGPYCPQPRTGPGSNGNNDTSSGGNGTGGEGGEGDPPL